MSSPGYWKAERLACRIYFSLPRNMGVQNVKQAIKGGMLAKADLVDGATYVGFCRHANQARWDAQSHRFVYTRRYRGALLKECIPHPEDDEGMDVFVPVGRIGPVKDTPADEGAGPGPNVAA